MQVSLNCLKQGTNSELQVGSLRDQAFFFSSATTTKKIKVRVIVHVRANFISSSKWAHGSMKEKAGNMRLDNYKRTSLTSHLRISLEETSFSSACTASSPFSSSIASLSTFTICLFKNFWRLCWAFGRNKTQCYLSKNNEVKKVCC